MPKKKGNNEVIPEVEDVDEISTDEPEETPEPPAEVEQEPPRTMAKGERRIF